MIGTIFGTDLSKLFIFFPRLDDELRAEMGENGQIQEAVGFGESSKLLVLSLFLFLERNYFSEVFGISPSSHPNATPLQKYKRITVTVKQEISK